MSTVPTCIGVAGDSAFRKVRSSDVSRSGIGSPSSRCDCPVTLAARADSGLRHWLNGNTALSVFVRQEGASRVPRLKRPLERSSTSMRSTLTRGTAAALLPTLGMLVLAGCGGGDSSSGASPSPSSSAPSATATDLPTSTSPGTPNTSSPSNTADPSGEQADVTINVTVANGKVNPSGATIKAKAGQTVLVTAVSDAADELHIHGY